MYVLNNPQWYTNLTSVGEWVGARRHWLNFTIFGWMDATIWKRTAVRASHVKGLNVYTLMLVRSQYVSHDIDQCLSSCEWRLPSSSIYIVFRSFLTVKRQKLSEARLLPNALI